MLVPKTISSSETSPVNDHSLNRIGGSEVELERLEIPCDGATATGLGAPGAGGTGVRAAEFPATGMTTERSRWQELPARPLGAGTVPSEHGGSKVLQGWNCLAGSHVLTPKPSTQTFHPPSGMWNPLLRGEGNLGRPCLGFLGKEMIFWRNVG